MAVLGSTELTQALQQLPKWRVEDGALVREVTFPSFPAAIQFVDQLAVRAEQHQHHPDIDIRYTRVRLSLVTHDAGGLTAKDIAMAAEIDALLSRSAG
ncbi:MAG: 4a-hydroxytetrahydrobiopterin dehydratase [Acidobacteriaceae bacterium]